MDVAREIALKTLYEISEKEAYSNLILDEMISKNRRRLSDKDIGFISELVYGVTTWRLTLDEIIKKYSKVRLKKISPWILEVLRLGIYQIVFLDKVPVSAAVNESVTLAKRYGHAASARFVNAVLRKVSKQDLEDFLTIEDKVTRISKTTSMPVWLVEKLGKNRSLDQVEEICNNLNRKPELVIRRNRLKISEEEYKRLLEEQNISYHETILKDFLVIGKQKHVKEMDLFEQGFLTVQDVSAGLAAFLLNPKEGEIVLDACSAPGGKTTYLAELMNNQGEIEAWDIHPHRTKLVEQNANRLGISIIHTEVRDASILDETKIEKFDKILLDVPCLGIGVIKRKPDIKWQRKPEDILEISKLQEKILQTCSKYLKPGGEILYSTCSILEEENEDIVKQFLQKNTDFEFVKLEFEQEEVEPWITILPDSIQDGFFIAKIRKN